METGLRSFSGCSRVRVPVVPDSTCQAMMMSSLRYRGGTNKEDAEVLKERSQLR